MVNMGQRGRGEKLTVLELSTGRPNYAASWSKAPPLIPSPPVGERAW
jgi:hypothetical protein